MFCSLHHSPLPIVSAKKPSHKFNPEFEWAFLHPRYWGLWLVFALWWLLVQLPYPIHILLGKCIGWIFLLGKERPAFTARNLELCFPEKTEKERRRILRKSFESAGIAFFEMGIAWWWPNWRLKRLTRIKGLEQAEKIAPQGAVLLGMHFTTLDIGGSCLSLEKSYGSMYRPHRNPVFNYVQFRGRCRNPNLVIFPREDLRTMIRLLRNGELVWYAPDQDYGEQFGIFAPFFGIPAATITATSKLVQMGKSVVIPFTHKRLSWFRGYEITLHPPLENFPTGDELQDATRINLEIEKHIRDNPEQYLWAHRRFKSRPPGEEDLYPFKKRSREIKNKKRAAKNK